MIQERERFTPEQLSSRTDLLSFFVSLKKQQAGEEKQTEQERNKYFKDFSQRPLDHNYIRDLILNFMIAGRDTTAQTLSWFVFVLVFLFFLCYFLPFPLFALNFFLCIASYYCVFCFLVFLLFVAML